MASLPVDPHLYLTFLGVMMVMAITPGPANLFSVANGVQRGKAAAMAGVVGMNAATLDTGRGTKRERLTFSVSVWFSLSRVSLKRSFTPTFLLHLVRLIRLRLQTLRHRLLLLLHLVSRVANWTYWALSVFARVIEPGNEREMQRVSDWDCTDHIHKPVHCVVG